MNYTSKKTKTIITLFLTLTISLTFAALPLDNAHSPPWDLPTYCYIALASPNPIGVGEEAVVVYWLNALPQTAQGAYGDRFTFYVDVTKPDGSKQQLGPYTSDPVGGGWATYTPTDVGTYTFVARFPGHKYTGLPFPPGLNVNTISGAAYVNDTLLASTSDPLELRVQANPVSKWPEAPLPTEYWTRPINSANRDWYSLAGNWLGGANQNVGPTTRFAYGTGPESSHIMWTFPYWAGGLADAQFGDIGYQMDHYHGIRFQPPIILNGKIYYNVLEEPRYGWICRDLYTGEMEYFHNTTGPVTGVAGAGNFDDPGAIIGERLDFGQILEITYPNEHGCKPYLWSTTHPTQSNTWMMYDAFTGNYICSIANVSTSGTQFVDKIGSICRLRIQNYGNSTNPKNYLQIWNTTHAIWYEPTWSSNEYWMWRPDLNATFNGNNGYSLNVSVPASITGSIYAIRTDKFVIGGTSGTNDDRGIVQGNLWCLSLEAGKEGSLLWSLSFTPPKMSKGNPDTVYSGNIIGPTVVPEYDVMLFEEETTRIRWTYSLKTGQLLWESKPELQMNFYAMDDNVYDGKLFAYGYGGQLIAYDIKTGDILWTYNATNVGWESPYGENFPLNYLACIADGKLYMYSSEHSVTQPPWRGSYLRCINASNGVELWKVLNWADRRAGPVIADGYLVALNEYDDQVYCYGKGPSATEVSVQDNVITNGDSVLITGKVTDISPGTKTLKLAARFPNGVPAISDESMSAWMEYLYSDQAMPMANGVEVKLETLDPNGNFYEIGKTTSDASGMFKLMFTPEVPGEYTIIASFGGSKSYWPSQAETAIGVTQTSEATPQPTTTQASTTDMYLLPGIGIIVAAIAIVGALILLTLRKRP